VEKPPQENEAQNPIVTEYDESHQFWVAHHIQYPGLMMIDADKQNAIDRLKRLLGGE